MVKQSSAVMELLVLGGDGLFPSCLVHSCGSWEALPIRVQIISMDDGGVCWDRRLQRIQLWENWKWSIGGKGGKFSREEYVNVYIESHEMP